MACQSPYHSPEHDGRGTFRCPDCGKFICEGCHVPHKVFCGRMETAIPETPETPQSSKRTRQEQIDRNLEKINHLKGILELKKKLEQAKKTKKDKLKEEIEKLKQAKKDKLAKEIEKLKLKLKLKLEIAELKKKLAERGP